MLQRLLSHDLPRSRWLALGLAMACTLAFPAVAEGPTEIDLFFPVPVDGKLARDMGTLIKEFNETHPDIKTTAVYTGSYDDTLIKTRAAIKAGTVSSARIFPWSMIATRLHSRCASSM